MLRLFVSGTNTEVGKTVFCGLLARHLKDKGLAVRYIKPVQTGHPPDDDSRTVRELSGLSETETRLLFTAEEPVSPSFVFDPFPFEEAVAAINAERDCDVLIVESAGGLAVPLDKTRRNFDIARACGLETLLVVPNRLGCLNDAWLNHYFLKNEGLPFFGFAVNGHFSTNPSLAERNKRELDRFAPGSVRYEFDELLTEK